MIYICLNTQLLARVQDLPQSRPGQVWHQTHWGWHHFLCQHQIAPWQVDKLLADLWSLWSPKQGGIDTLGLIPLHIHKLQLIICCDSPWRQLDDESPHTPDNPPTPHRGRLNHDNGALRSGRLLDAMTGKGHASHLCSVIGIDKAATSCRPHAHALLVFRECEVRAAAPWCPRWQHPLDLPAVSVCGL